MTTYSADRRGGYSDQVPSPSYEAPKISDADRETLENNASVLVDRMVEAEQSLLQRTYERENEEMEDREGFQRYGEGENSASITYHAKAPKEVSVSFNGPIYQGQGVEIKLTDAKKVLLFRDEDEQLSGGTFYDVVKDMLEELGYEVIN